MIFTRFRGQRVKVTLENIGSENSVEFEKKSVALLGALAEFGTAALEGDLERAERRAVAVHEDSLNIATIDGRICLEEEAQEEIFGEKGVAPDHVNPGNLFFRIGIEIQML